MEHILKGLASLASKEPSEYVTTLKGQDGEFLPEEEIVERLKGDISSHFKTIAENQYKRGMRERGESLEKYIRDQYGLDSKDQGEDLIKALAEKLSSNQKVIEKPVELTDEKIIEHPLFKETLETRLKEVVKARVSELEGQLEEEKSKYANHLRKLELETINQVVREKATQVLLGIKAKLGDSEEEKAKRLNFFLNTLDPAKFKLDENREPFPVNEKGERLQHKDTYHDISFADLIKEANPYGVHTQDPDRGSASPSTRNGNQPGGQPMRIGQMTEKEFAVKLGAIKDKEKRKAFIEAYKAQLEKA